MSKLPVYFDSAASMRPDSRVVEAMLPWLNDYHTNPHANHMYGQFAELEIDASKCNISKLINCDKESVYFTSGATESINTALNILSSNYNESTLIISQIEHKCVFECAKYLQNKGVNIVIVPVMANGLIDLIALDVALKSADTPIKLLSVQHANNETGIVQNIHEILTIADKYEAITHLDASQSVGKIKIDFNSLNLNMLSFSAHKIGGPQGIGCLIIKSDFKNQIKPLLFGGGQQESIRPGTLPTFLVAGFSKAAVLIINEFDQLNSTYSSLKNYFIEQLRNNDLKFIIIGSNSNCLSNIFSVYFEELDMTDFIYRNIQEFAISQGSACSSDVSESYVYKAAGFTNSQLKSIVRIGLSKDITFKNLDSLVSRIKLFSMQTLE